ncbi:hypothetical protein G6O69_24650 [Pseudenhygromyxa sp. WMMC2535]|uniref:efflux RND transporter periplasmic adaptor subunit n=1 Tax=Pseudenhygromyxa sp. WMMC2535 TaxID=2712867 RepID=UPI001553C3A2|nr:hypothetical protein [Pseudenhygromyxa sp. WMMC2535]NVB41053.1 hypothetical protein [Pseudenhygromyxa sp. WMMC2535]
MPRSDSPLIRTITFVGLTGIGLGLYLWLSKAEERPRAQGQGDRGQSVRIIEVQETEAVPRVTGYGEVEAARSWEGMAEVGGTIIEMDSDLQVGRLIREGTVLFEIDPEELELEKKRTVASAKGVKAQIYELEVREKSTKASLEVEQKVLALVNKELERTQTLYRQGNAALSEVETAESAVLSAEKSVISLKNTLAELPAERRILAAQLEEVNAGVTGAELDLSRTKIVAPFTMRISELNVTTGQTVSASQVLVVGEGLDVLEVTARLPIGGIDPLLPDPPEPPTRTSESGQGSGAETPPAEGEGPPPEGEEGAQPPPEDAPGGTQDAPAGTRDAPAGTRDAPAGAEGASGDQAASTTTRRRGGWISRIAEYVHPTVRLRMTGVDASWPARFGRFAGVDPLTRTSGVVVEIDRSQRRAGSRDVRLSSGMHVSVEFVGEPKPGCLALPIEAVHEGQVYVVDADSRLEVREIEIDWSQESFVCVATGIAAGDQVIISEIVPAVDGMRVDPTVDEFETARLAELVAAPEAEAEADADAEAATEAAGGAAEADAAKTEAAAAGGAEGDAQ